MACPTRPIDARVPATQLNDRRWHEPRLLSIPRHSFGLPLSCFSFLTMVSLTSWQKEMHVRVQSRKVQVLGGASGDLH